MGERYDHVCERCSFSAHVSGGTDAGAVADAETVRCTRCGSLHDRVTALRQGMPPFDVPLPGCPECGAPPAELLAWVTGDPCPRCGHPLQAGGGTISMWDQARVAVTLIRRRFDPAGGMSPNSC